MQPSLAWTSSAKPFNCPHPSCSKSFATYRGLNKHWDYEPEHRDPERVQQCMAKANNAAVLAALPMPSAPVDPPKLPPTPAQTEPAPIRVPEATPILSPASSGSSIVPVRAPVRTATAVPSCIRTRRRSNTDGIKREEGEASAKRQPSTGGTNPPPAKALHLSTGEKVPIGEEEEEDEEEEEEEEEEEAEVGGARKQHKGANRPRMHSLSSPDNTPPPSVQTVLSASELTRSPITRSTRASKRIEFVSLPVRKKRKGRRGGSGKAGEQVETSPSPSPSKPQEKPLESSPLLPAPAEPQPPVKRKRGRPPKRRDPPPPPPSSSSTSSTPTPSTSSSSSQSTPAAGLSSSTKTTPSTGSSLASASAGASGDRGGSREPRPMEESPLPSTAKKDGATGQSTIDLPLWESIGEEPQRSGPADKTAPRSTLPPEGKSSTVPELPAIQPSILPPTGTIPGAPPKVYSKSGEGGDALSSEPAAGHDRRTSEGGRERPSEGRRRKTRHSSEAMTDRGEHKSPPEEESSVGGDTDTSPAPPPKPRPRGRPKSKGKPGKSVGSHAKKASSHGSQEGVTQSEGDKPREAQGSTGAEAGSGGSRKSSDDKEEEEEEEGGAVPSGAGQRSASVFVSVLAGPEKRAERRDGMTGDELGEEEGDMDGAKKSDARRRLSMTESPAPPMAYPPPGPGSFPYPFPPPHHHPMMFPGPGASYPPGPYYGPYPTATVPGAYIPGPMGGMMAPHPGMMEPGADSLPASFCLPFTSAGVPITTVSGVRVSVLDKPPSHLPTVSVQQLARPRCAPGVTYEQALPPPLPPGTTGQSHIPPCTYVLSTLFSLLSPSLSLPPSFLSPSYLPSYLPPFLPPFLPPSLPPFLLPSPSYLSPSISDGHGPHTPPPLPGLPLGCGCAPGPCLWASVTLRLCAV